MKRLLAMSAAAMMMSAAAMAAPGAGAAKSDSLSLLSPDKKLELNFYLTDKGEPFYSLKFNGQNVIDDSRLGFDIRHEGGVSDIQPFMNGWEVKESNTVLRPSQMREGFILDSTARTTVDYTWEPVWGEEKEIRDHHNELAVYLRQPMSSAFGTETDEDRMIVIRFRLFNDGLGFRYEFPKQKTLGYFIVRNELTEFTFHEDLTTFWIAGDYDSNEFIYETSPMSRIAAPCRCPECRPR